MKQEQKFIVVENRTYCEELNQFFTQGFYIEVFGKNLPDGHLTVTIPSTLEEAEEDLKSFQG